MTAARELRGASSRRPADRRARLLAVTTSALAVLLLTCVAASDQRVPEVEREVFRLINDRSLLPFAAVWPVMQLGNLVVGPVVAAVLAVRGRLLLAAQVLTAGLAAYVLAKVVKAVVERPRPDALLEQVVVRGPDVSDHGFVSGHTAVATAVVAVLLPYVGRRTRVVLCALAVLVALSRVYVGAHLPLDVVGGAALSIGVAGVIHLLVGALVGPVRRPPAGPTDAPGGAP